MFVRTNASDKIISVIDVLKSMTADIQSAIDKLAILGVPTDRRSKSRTTNLFTTKYPTSFCAINVRILLNNTLNYDVRMKFMEDIILAAQCHLKGFEIATTYKYRIDKNLKLSGGCARVRQA